MSPVFTCHGGASYVKTVRIRISDSLLVVYTYISSVSMLVFTYLTIDKYNHLSMSV